VAKARKSSNLIEHVNQEESANAVYVESIFEKEYFQDSEHTLSNYEDYCRRRYEGLCQALITECGIQKDDYIIDYGCATGALLAAFKAHGYTNVVGTDISYWAIEYGKTKLGLESELQYYNRNLLVQDKDWLIMLDVLEHMPTENELRLTLKLVSHRIPRKGMILRVPVPVKEGEDYYLEASRFDKTHVQRHTKKWWLSLLSEFGLHASKYFSEKPDIWDSKGVLAVLLTLGIEKK